MNKIEHNNVTFAISKKICPHPYQYRDWEMVNDKRVDYCERCEKRIPARKRA